MNFVNELNTKLIEIFGDTADLTTSPDSNTYVALSNGRTVYIDYVALCGDPLDYHHHTMARIVANDIDEYLYVISTDILMPRVKYSKALYIELIHDIVNGLMTIECIKK